MEWAAPTRATEAHALSVRVWADDKKQGAKHPEIATDRVTDRGDTWAFERRQSSGNRPRAMALDPDAIRRLSAARNPPLFLFTPPINNDSTRLNSRYYIAPTQAQHGHSQPRTSRGTAVHRGQTILDWLSQVNRCFAPCPSNIKICGAFGPQATNCSVGQGGAVISLARWASARVETFARARQWLQTTLTVMEPSPSTSSTMMSPGTTAFTPAGVPDKITSPGFSSKYSDR